MWCVEEDRQLKGRSMAGSCIGSKGHSGRAVSFLLIAIIVLSAVPVCVSGSTYPPSPRVLVYVGNKTIKPGSGLDISVEWEQAATEWPIPPDTIGIALYNILDGSLLGTYTIPKTGERDGGVIHEFRGTIPHSILPAGDVMIIATDPISGAYSRVAVNILTPGESYPAYRNRQVMEGTFYPVATCLIVILAIVLGILVMKPQERAS
jgi:hypothetical protein